MAGMNSRPVQQRVIFEQDTPPNTVSSVVWIDTSGEQPTAKIFDPAVAEWLSVGVVDYSNLSNKPQKTFYQDVDDSEFERLDDNSVQYEVEPETTRTVSGVLELDDPDPDDDLTDEIEKSVSMNQQFTSTQESTLDYTFTLFDGTTFTDTIVDQDSHREYLNIGATPTGDITATLEYSAELTNTDDSNTRSFTIGTHIDWWKSGPEAHTHPIPESEV